MLDCRCGREGIAMWRWFLEVVIDLEMPSYPKLRLARESISEI